MRINKIIMKVGVSLIVLTLIGCITFSYFTKLKNPVFLRCCIETQAIADSTPVMQLRYITNIKDKRKVCNISFLETPEVFFYASEDSYGNSGFTFYNNGIQQIGNNIGRYNLRTVYVYLDFNTMEKLKDTTELNNAQIGFNDGSTLAVDLGRIILYRDNISHGNTLSQESGRSSNDFSSLQTYSVEEDITLQDMKSPLLDEAPKSMDFKVDGINYYDISGVKYTSRDRINIGINFNDDQNQDMKYDVYDIRPKLLYENADKTTDYIRILNIRWERGLYEYKDLLSYLHDRGAI